MNKNRIKAVMHQQNKLFTSAIYQKLHQLSDGNDFSTDVFAEAEEIEFDKIENSLDSNVIYSHRPQTLAHELPRNKIASYQQTIASLRGIEIVDDYNVIKKNKFK